MNGYRTSNKYEVRIVLEYAAEGKVGTLESIVLVAGNDVPPTKYSITYDLDGGYIYGEPIEYTESITLNDIPVPTKSNCKFAYWLVNGELIGENVVLTGDLELTAVWNTIGDIDDNPSGGSSCNMGASIKYIMTLTSMLGLLIVVIRKRK